MHFHFKLILFVLSVSLGLSSLMTTLLLNNQIDNRIRPLESRIRMLERKNSEFSAALQVEAVKRQNDVQQVDDKQFANYNFIRQSVDAEGVIREETTKYRQVQSFFMDAVAEAAANRLELARSLALAGMSIATADSVYGCSKGRPAMVAIGEPEWVPILISLLADSRYQIVQIPRASAEDVLFVQVTPVKFLAGC